MEPQKLTSGKNVANGNILIDWILVNVGPVFLKSDLTLAGPFRKT